MVDGRIFEPRSCPTCTARHMLSLLTWCSPFPGKNMTRLKGASETALKGEISAKLMLAMYDSLVDQKKPGDRVEISCIISTTPARLNYL